MFNRGVRSLPGFILIILLMCICAFATWWFMQKPSHDREWADDVTHLLKSSVQGNQVTLSNVRNFEWRSETDYTPRWETREYDLSQLQSADLILSYWMGPHIAHTLVSFGFSDGRQLVYSLEIRKEKGEEFSAIAGFFRQYETIIVAADEKDIVRVRTNVRGEDVYLYRLDIPHEQLRTLFMGYLNRAANLERSPTFYNTLTSNCTTVVYQLAKLIVPGLPLDYRLLASGYFADYVYEQGGLTKNMSFDALHLRGRITDRAKATPIDEDYSKVIRAGVPGIDTQAINGPASEGNDKARQDAG
jgi:hypothetical protein